jgi:HK97 family phage major capsid protein
MSAINKLKKLNEDLGAKSKEIRTYIDKAAAEKRSIPADDGTFKQLEADYERMKSEFDVEMRQAARESGTPVDLTRSEKRSVDAFDLGKALRSQVNPNLTPLDGVERELAQEGLKEAREAGVQNTEGGIMLPRALVHRCQRGYRGQQQFARDMTATGTTSVTGDQGGMTVATTPMGLMDAFYNDDVLEGLGMTSFNGAVGNLAFPRFVRGTAPTHKPENGASDEASPTTAKLSLSPKRLPSYIDVSQQLLLQSNVNIQAFLEQSIIQEIRSLMQISLLHGTGANDQPTGIAATTGIGAVYAGGAAANNTNADGAAPVWADMINLKKKVAVANANRGRTNYLFNESLMGKLEQTVRVASTDSMFIVDDRAGGRIRGHLPAVTNAVSSTLTKGASSGILSGGFYGNWQDLIRAIWGGFNLKASTDATLDAAGLVRILGAVYYDGGVLRPASFSYCADFNPA